MNKGDCFFIGVIVGVILMLITITIYQDEVVDGVKVDSTVVWKDDFKK